MIAQLANKVADKLNIQCIVVDEYDCLSIDFGPTLSVYFSWKAKFCLPTGGFEFSHNPVEDLNVSEAICHFDFNCLWFWVGGTRWKKL